MKRKNKSWNATIEFIGIWCKAVRINMDYVCFTDCAEITVDGVEFNQFKLKMGRRTVTIHRKDNEIIPISEDSEYTFLFKTTKGEILEVAPLVLTKL